MVITISCPSCQTSFPVDPDKIPTGGVRVRCSACAHVFRVEKPEPEIAVARGDGAAVASGGSAAVAPQERAGITSDASSAAAEPQGSEGAGSGASGATDGFARGTDQADQADTAEATSEGGGWFERDPFEQEREAPVGAAGADGNSQPDQATATEGEPADAAFTGPTGDVFADPAHERVAEPAAEPSADGFAGQAGEPSRDAFAEAFAEEPTDDGTSDEAAAEPATHRPDEPVAEPPADPLYESAAEVSGDAVADPDLKAVEASTPSIDAAASDAHTAAEQPEDVPVQGFTFGKRDPTDKARRLARVLVSDMIMYNAERHQVALAQDTLAEDFQEEIDKSWKEYVDQVGPGMAEGEGRAFWIHALNDILAKGRDVF